MPAASLETIVSLAKRRGFVFPSSSVYGGLASTWDYGPLGVELKNNVKRAWWRKVVHERDDMEGLDAAILMNRLVWKYSGHEATFSDPMTDCRACKSRPRADHVFKAQKGRDPMGLAEINAAIAAKELACPKCGSKDLTAARPFNLMFRTTMGPVDTGDDSRPGLPAARDRAGHLRQLPERAGYHAAQAALRHRPDRQGVPQRGHARQLHLPHARVRADGDRVLRQAGRGRGRAPDVDRRAHAAGTTTSACSTENLRQREQTQGRAGPLRQALRRSGVPVPHGLRASWKASPTAPTSISRRTAAAPRTPIRSASCATSIRRPSSTSCPTSSSRRRAPTGPRWPSCATPTRTRWSRRRPPRRRPSCASWCESFVKSAAKRDNLPADVKDRLVTEGEAIAKAPAGIAAAAAGPDGRSRRQPHRGHEEGARRRREDGRGIHPHRAAPAPAAGPHQGGGVPAQEERAAAGGDGPRRSKRELQAGGIRTVYDDTGAIGKLYRRQDEIGTPCCVTVDFQSLDDGTVTVRDRDTMAQDRVKLGRARALGRGETALNAGVPARPGRSEPFAVWSGGPGRAGAQEFKG